MLAVMVSCKKDESNDGKGEGALTVNEQSYSIIESCMWVKNDGTMSRIVFSNNVGIVVNIETDNITLTSKTYTATEIDAVWLPIVGEGDFDEDDVEMTVVKSGSTYDITISGKSKVNEYEYTMTYKGKIRAEKDLCN